MKKLLSLLLVFVMLMALVPTNISAAAPTPTYTVTFNANGHGIAPDALSDVVEGSKISAPTAPTADGYTFGGWYKESTCENAWDFGNDTVVANTTLYAKWTENPPQIIYADLRILIDDIDDVRDVFSGYADVCESGDAIVIKLTSNILGRIYLNNNDGNFILDLNDNTLDPATEYDQPICADHNFTGSLTITGSGSIKKGKTDLLYVSPSHKDAVKIMPKSGYDYFTAKADGDNIFGDEKNTTVKTYAKDIADREYFSKNELVITQGILGKYTVTFNANGHGIAPDALSDVVEGSKISAPTAPTADGYTFGGWYKEAGCENAWDFENDAVVANTTLYAKWTYAGGGGGGGSTGGSSVRKFTIKFETNGGSVVSDVSVTKSAKLSEPTAPVKDDFTFGGWYTDKELTTAYDFSLAVTKNFTLYAKWIEVEETEGVEPEITLSFKDVSETDWFYKNVQFVVKNKLMNGVAADKFAPSNTLTRAMLVTILYRSEGEPAVSGGIPFADVDNGSYYANAVIWAKETVL